MLVWLDLETTGLEPRADLPLEIAVVITDDDLHVKAEYLSIVPWDLDAVESRLIPLVRDMHTKSGLLHDLHVLTPTTAFARKARRTAIEGEVSAFIERNGALKAPMCGNTIGFDRGFLAEYMPKINAACHYRSIDVSSVNELARRWDPASYKARPEGTGTQHRALDDVRHSIKTLAHYRACGFLRRV